MQRIPKETHFPSKNIIRARQAERLYSIFWEVKKASSEIPRKLFSFQETGF
jgi:hypothetical protein